MNLNLFSLQVSLKIGVIFFDQIPKASIRVQLRRNRRKADSVDAVEIGTQLDLHLVQDARSHSPRFQPHLVLLQGLVMAPLNSDHSQKSHSAECDGENQLEKVNTPR